MSQSPMPVIPPPRDASPPGDPAFDFAALPALGVCDVDRFCERCGANFRGEAIRREPRTAVLVVRCANCGRFEPANELAPATSRWSRKQAQGLVVMLLLLAPAGLAINMGIFAGMVSESYRQFLDYSNWSPSSTPSFLFWPRDAGEFGAMLLVTGCLSFGLVFLTTVMTPHWHRWGNFTFAALWPVIPGGLLLCAEYNSSRELVVVAIVLALHHLAAFVGGFAAAWKGRALARLLASIILAQRLRTYMSYLWTVDGLPPPKTDADPTP